MRYGLVALLLFSSCLRAQTGEEKRRISSPIAFYDDTDIVAPGMVNVSQYFSYTKVSAGRDVSLPSAYFALGLHKRVGISGSASYSQSRFEQSRINGRGDSYFAAKVLLLPEGKRRPALAVEPMVEILGDASIADSPLAPNRVNYVFPMMVQKSSDYYRVYYTAGYLTRGIIFNSLAFELNAWSRVTPIGIVSASRLTNELALVSDLGLNRSRSDALGGVAVTIRPGWAVFANAGRSFGRLDENSSRYQVTFGFSFNARLWGKK